MVYSFPEEEKKILKFWEENRIFEKLREKNKRGKRWSFLDGPITANNPMGVHHAWGRTYKDLLQRYHAMKGHNERYQNGFDCQGLWVEVEVEKELGFKTKKDIEAYGIDKFVEKCKERVRKYSAIQIQQSIRLGQWMDWENSYYTMSDENNYAIWHFLKRCWELGYLYKGRDSVPWCPRCGTAISQHEILTEEYKKITHDSIYFRLPLIDKENEYLLVWTTTPWTLPANISVAVDENLDYALVQDQSGFKNWVAKDLVEKIFKGKQKKVVKIIKGKELVGLKYISAFDELPRIKETAGKFPENFHKVISTDKRIMPINIEEGTGLVHTAVSAGEEDFKLGQKLGLPMVEVIDEQANYLDGFGEFSFKNAKKDPKIILEYLAENKVMPWVFEISPYKHKYPTCWRCKTELVWRVVDEWYIAMDKPSKAKTNSSTPLRARNQKPKSLRTDLIDIAKKINWIPEFGLERELDWLGNMRDWLISKKRYWGLALPIFECKECGKFEVIGSKEELKKRAVEGWESFEGKSPHRPWVDNVKIRCRGIIRDLDRERDKKCNALISRIKDVGNPWLDAGIVPFSTMKYFSDKSYWKKWFPAKVVCESFPGQFKNWFYSLLVMSAALEKTAPVKTIFGYAAVRDEKGEEMHKSKGNAIWFDEAVEKIGADPMRWFYARLNPADNANFGYNVVEEVKRKLLILYNTYFFFITYVDRKDFPPVVNLKKWQANNILDKWILSKIDYLIPIVEFNLEKYNIAKAVLAVEGFFINDLSLWYIRRSRKRFHASSDADLAKSDLSSEDSSQGGLNPNRKEAIATLYYVLISLAKLIAPIAPFFAESLYQALKQENMVESIHLFDWPEVKGKSDLDLEQLMDEARNVVTLALAERSGAGIKIRQPLGKLKIKNEKSTLRSRSGQEIKNYEDILDLIKDEINVKEIAFDDKINKEIELDINITQELKKEGLIREIIRSGNELRKQGGYMRNMYIADIISTSKIVFNNEVLKELRVKKAIEISDEEQIPSDYIKKEVKVEEGKRDVIAIPNLKNRPTD